MPNLPLPAHSFPPGDASPARVHYLRQLLARSRGGKVQFIVDPAIGFFGGETAEASGFIARDNRIVLNPRLSDAQLLRELGLRCFEGNVHRYKTRFRTLALIERVPGIRGLWTRIIETMTDAVVADLILLGVPGMDQIPRAQGRLDRDALAARTIEEILEVVNHGIDGYVRRQVQDDPAFRRRVAAVLPADDPLVA